VFPNNYGRYLSWPTLYSFFKKLLKEAGLSDMHFHDLRHSVATILIAAKVDLKTMQELLAVFLQNVATGTWKLMSRKNACHARRDYSSN